MRNSSLPRKGRERQNRSLGQLAMMARGNIPTSLCSLVTPVATGGGGLGLLEAVKVELWLSGDNIPSKVPDVWAIEWSGVSEDIEISHSSACQPARSSLP